MKLLSLALFVSMSAFAVISDDGTMRNHDGVARVEITLGDTDIRSRLIAPDFRIFESEEVDTFVGGIHSHVDKLLYQHPKYSRELSEAYVATFVATALYCANAPEKYSVLEVMQKFATREKQVFQFQSKGVPVSLMRELSEKAALAPSFDDEQTKIIAAHFRELLYSAFRTTSLKLDLKIVSQVSRAKPPLLVPPPPPPKTPLATRPAPAARTTAPGSQAPVGAGIPSEIRVPPPAPKGETVDDLK